MASERRFSFVIPATVVATASLGAYLYFSGRLRFMTGFPFLSCSLRRSFAAVTPRAPPRLGAVKSGLSVDPKSYPWVHRDAEVVEDKFGVKVADPYRWLENPESPRTAAFIESQNLFTEQVLEQCDSREKFKQLFKSMYDSPKFGCPHEEAGKYYFSFNTGLQNQSCVFVDDGTFQKPALFLDPNEWSEDGTVALTSTSFSESGDLMGYTVSRGGSDWQKIKVLSVREEPVNGRLNEELPDELEFVKFSPISWTHDEAGFFYCRFPDSTNGALGTQNQTTKYHHICYHVMGTPQSEDVVVLKMENEPDYMFFPEVTEDGKYVVISIVQGCSPGSAISYLDLSQIPKNEKGVLDFVNCASKIVPLVKGIDDSYSFVANEGSVFTFKTNNNAPRQKLVQVDIANSRKWTDLVPQHETDVLQWACAIAGDRMVLCYLHDCSNILELRKLSTGEKIKEIEIPKYGSLTAFSGKKTSSEVFFAHQSFTVPPTIYRYQAETDALSVVNQTRIAGFDPNAYQTEQVFVDSYDKKVKIPMFVMHKKDIALDEKNPTLLTGYGGFGVSIPPRFSVSSAAFVMAYGGVLASANLRGGNEYGLKWREGGNLGNKQNVFDDFHACGEYLIQKRYCNPSRLAIRGGSNGGLLVAACANQRPDLFGCVVSDVGVLDMMRFHKFTAGHAWLPEYGNPDKLDDFEYLIKYSPLHNVRVPLDGTCQYPAILLTTGDHDDRVSPLHTFKFLAELQHVLCAGAESRQTNPLVARILTKAGHGAGKPTSLIIDEVADITAFIAAAIKADWKLA